MDGVSTSVGVTDKFSRIFGAFSLLVDLAIDCYIRLGPEIPKNQVFVKTQNQVVMILMAVLVQKM